MCECGSKAQKYGSLYQLNQEQRTRLVKRLPGIVQKRNYACKTRYAKETERNIADTVFVNGKIYTINEKEEVVQAVATRGENIIFVGNFLDALSFITQQTNVINLNGKTLLPGFIDPHVHMFFSMANNFLDLSPFVNENMDQVKQRIIDQVKKAPKGSWVKTQLFDPTITDGEFDVSRWGLDKLCPQVLENQICIYILEANGHVAHVNTRALDVSGVTTQTTIPFGTFIKNQKGQLTGQLQQSAVMYMKQFLFPPQGDYYQENFRNFLVDCTTKGVTSLHDCGIGNVEPEADIAILNQVFSPDQNPVIRYSGFLVSTNWDYWMKNGYVPEKNDPLLRINGVKAWCDGSLQGGSGFLREPYLKSEWGVGTPNYTLEQLTNSIRQANDRGWQVGVHGNGDAGIDRILDAYEEVKKTSKTDFQSLRHRIEHCTVCHRQQLQRMKQLGIHPSFLIGHIYYYGDVFRRQILGEERAGMLDPMRSAVDLGLRPTVHSDYNCQPIDPIRCIYNAVTRNMKPNGLPLNEKECVTPYEAIKAVTIDSAWQCHIEDIVGSIEVGKKADFVILDKDPLNVQKNDLINLKVVQTWMNGRLTYKGQELTSSKFMDLLTSFKKAKNENEGSVMVPINN